MDLFCNKCSLQFGKKYVFDLHLSLVHGEKMEVKIEPLISEENFQEPKTSEQVVSDHVVDTGLKCTICYSIFKTKQNLKKHIDGVHEGKKPFKCDVCDASFSQKINLTEHVASVHEGKKPFKCNICDASFSHRGNLNKHVTSVHEGLKPHKKGSLQQFMKKKSPLNLKKV